jgi:RNA polymerase sigma-70 factor (ECF subfamily)
VGTRAAIDSLRRSKRRGVQEELGSETGGKADDGLEDPLNRLMRKERIAQVRSTLAELKPEKAQLLLLRHSGLSYQEIAAALEMKPGSVGTKLARAEAEFLTHYEKGQRLGRRAAHLETAKEG